MRYQVEVNGEPLALFAFVGDALNWADSLGLDPVHKFSEIVVVNILRDDVLYILSNDRYAHTID